MSVYAQNLLRELVALGHEVTMISQYRGDEVGTRVYGGGPPPPVPGVRVIGLEALGEQEQPVASFERDIATMVQTAVAEHARSPFDLLHAQYGYPTGLAALETSRRLGLPNVVSIQGGDGHWVGVNCCETHREAMRAVLNHAGALLIGSRSFAEEVRENHGTPPERWTVVPGAVDATRFRPREDWRSGDWIDPSQPTILYHGRVDRRKGALDLLDAFATLRRRGHPLAQRARLLYSGIGPDSAAVAERVQALRLDDAFTGLGYVDYADVPAVYRRADLFASPTYSEGFSNTILEAMASGLANVSCFAVGVNDCLRDRDNGLLVEPGDVPAQVDALERIITDAGLRRRIARAGLDECRQRYSWSAVGRTIMEVYGRVLREVPDGGFDPVLPFTPCRFRAEPHLL